MAEEMNVDPDLWNEDRVELAYCLREQASVDAHIVEEGDDVRWVDSRVEVDVDAFLVMLRTRGMAVVRITPKDPVTHPPQAHDLLAPDDVPRHLREHHGQEGADVETRIDPDEYLLTHGIESTGDPELDAATVHHERLHEAEEDEACAACGRPVGDH